MTVRPAPSHLASARTRVLSALGAGALALALAGCGGASDTADPASSAPPEGYGEKELLAAMKAAVAENETTHVEMSFGSGGRAVRGEGDVSYAGDRTTMQMTMDMSGMGTPGGAGGGQGMGGTMEVRLVDEVLFLAAPGMTPPGMFLRVGPDNPMMKQFGSFTQGDPLSTFDAFEAGLTRARFLGEKEVDGETLDHYRLTVDSAAAAKSTDMIAPQGMPKTLTYELYLDDEDLMRRVETEAGGVRTEVTMDEWGEPVDVEAPPKSQVQEMPNLSRG